MTSLKFRLPTWRLRTTKPYDSKPRQTPTDSEWLLNSKWFNQQPLLSEKQLGDKEISTYFNCDFSTLQLLLLMLRGGRSNVVGNGDRSDGRSLCWDDIDAEDVVFVVFCCCSQKIRGGGLLKRRLQLTFSQLALITTTIFRPSEELFNCRTGF